MDDFLRIKRLGDTLKYSFEEEIPNDEISLYNMSCLLASLGQLVLNGIMDRERARFIPMMEMLDNNGNRNYVINSLQSEMLNLVEETCNKQVASIEELYEYLNRYEIEKYLLICPDLLFWIDDYGRNIVDGILYFSRGPEGVSGFKKHYNNPFCSISIKDIEEAKISSIGYLDNSITVIDEDAEGLTVVDNVEGTIFKWYRFATNEVCFFDTNEMKITESGWLHQDYFKNTNADSSKHKGIAFRSTGFEEYTEIVCSPNKECYGYLKGNKVICDEEWIVMFGNCVKEYDKLLEIDNKNQEEVLELISVFNFTKKRFIDKNINNEIIKVLDYYINELEYLVDDE